MDKHSPDESAARAALLHAARRLDQLGLNRGTSGNLSVRVDGGALITPSGVAPENLTVQAMVRVDLDGVVQGAGVPSSEWRMHCDILAARPESGAVVHTHSSFAVTLSTLRRDIPAFHYMIATAGGDSVRCAGYALFGSSELSRLAVEAIKDRKACLLGNHGLIALGRNLDEAIAVAVEVEALCEQYWRALQIGEPVLLTDEQMAQVLEKFRGYGRWRDTESKAR
jgi:L-fuculose-phosphate aldolase